MNYDNSLSSNTQIIECIKFLQIQNNKQTAKIIAVSFTPNTSAIQKTISPTQYQYWKEKKSNIKQSSRLIHNYTRILKSSKQVK